MSLLRAESDANTDLTGSLTYDKGDHPVDADACEQQGDPREHPQQYHREALCQDRLVVDNIVHRLGVKHHQFTIDLLDFATDDVDEAEGFAGHSQHYGCAAIYARYVFVGNLLERKIEFRTHREFFVESPLLHVPDHPDDSRGTNVIIHKKFSYGIFAGEKFIGEVLIDHSHARRDLAVLGGEKTSAYQRDTHHFQIVRLDFRPDGPIFLVVAKRLRATFDPEGILRIGPHRK